MTVLAIFVALLLVSIAAVAFVIEPSKADKRIHERLASLDNRYEAKAEPEDEIIKHTTFSNIHWVDEFLRHNHLATNLQRIFEQAELHWSVGRFVFASLLCSAFGVLISTYYISANWFGWIVGLGLGAGPYFYVMRKRAQRFRRFYLLLPDAIDLMTRALRAGHAVPACIDMIGTEVADPVGMEFRRAADEQSFGLPFREAMLNLSRRVPISDLNFMVTAMLVQKETGGNLAEVLDKTGVVLRGRLRLEGVIRVHTAQGRATGAILCALPFICFMALSVVNRGYMTVLFEDPLGKTLVQTALGLMAVGVLIVRKIVNVKV